MREPGTPRDARRSVCLGRSLRMPSVVPRSPPGPLPGRAGRACGVGAGPGRRDPGQGSRGRASPPWRSSSARSRSMVASSRSSAACPRSVPASLRCCAARASRSARSSAVTPGRFARVSSRLAMRSCASAMPSCTRASASWLRPVESSALRARSALRWASSASRSARSDAEAARWSGVSVIAASLIREGARHRSARACMSGSSRRWRARPVTLGAGRRLPVPPGQGRSCRRGSGRCRAHGRQGRA